MEENQTPDLEAFGVEDATSMGKHHALGLEGGRGLLRQWFILCGLCPLPGLGFGLGVSCALATCGSIIPEPQLCPVPSPAALAGPCWVTRWLATFGGLLHGLCSL